ncbi:hypothetical protein L1887_41817 [Cichorium endivia]|nr:hypothetical protein L1887_41817 [Cichorium endivia]
MGATRVFLIATMLAMSVAVCPQLAEAQPMAPSSDGPASMNEKSMQTKSMKQEHAKLEQQEKIVSSLLLWQILIWNQQQQQQNQQDFNQQYFWDSSAPLIQAPLFSWKRVLVLGFILFCVF